MGAGVLRCFEILNCSLCFQLGVQINVVLCFFGALIYNLGQRLSVLNVQLGDDRVGARGSLSLRMGRVSLACSLWFQIFWVV